MDEGWREEEEEDEGVRGMMLGGRGEEEQQ